MKTYRVLTETTRAHDHEFANCLHTVAGLLELELYDTAREFIADVARVRAARTEPRAERVREPLVSALLVGKSAVAAERGVTLRVCTGSHFPHRALVPQDLVMVLGNLIDNALDAVAAARTPGPRVDVELWAEARTAVLRVADNGPGVPADRRDLVFRAGWSTKEPRGGRGAGLAQVRSITERYAGTARVSEREGGGAVFTVRLPGALGTEAEGAW